MIHYYKGKAVESVRFFVLGGASKCEIVVDGETLIVNGDEVSDTLGEITSEFVPEPIVKEEKVESEVEVEEVKEELPEEPQPEPVKEEVEESKEITAFTPLLVTNTKSGKLFELDTLEDFEEFVKKNKLSVEAIEKVLDGEQRTHKGLEFVKNN